MKLAASLAILVALIGVPYLLSVVARWRRDEEDEARALRVQREYWVPGFAVAC